jgi:hypothetical protein
MLLTWASVIDLGGSQHILQWGWFRMTLGNLVVFGLMALVFAAAVAAPFPKGHRVSPVPAPEPPAPTDEGNGWTGALRRRVQKAFPWSKLLPSSQPSYLRSWTYAFGACTLAALVMIVTSGVALAIGGPAWRHRSSLGAFADDVHLWSVQLFFFFVVLHLATKAFLGSWRGRRLTWVMGSLALFASIATSLTGYVSQENFEAQWIATQAKDGLNAVGVGAFLNVLNTGQMLTIHIVVLPLTIAAIVTTHLLLVRLKGICPPLPSSKAHTAPTGRPIREVAP